MQFEIFEGDLDDCRPSISMIAKTCLQRCFKEFNFERKMYISIFHRNTALSMLFLAIAAPAWGQTATVAAGCFVAPARLADGQISAFLSAPETLLTSHVNGGIAMTSEVRGLAGSTESTLVPILSLVNSSATPGQISAIATGLARAARACAPTNPDYAERIQEQIVGLGNDVLLVAFSAALGETETAALGGGGGGGAAAGGQAGGIGGGGSAGGGSAGLNESSSPFAQGTSTFNGVTSNRYFSAGVSSTTSVLLVSPN